MSTSDWHRITFTEGFKIDSAVQPIGTAAAISGEAIHATTTRNGHVFTTDELTTAASTLIERPLLINHDNDVNAIVGKVTSAGWSASQNAVMFKAIVQEPKYAAMVADGRINKVSVGAAVKDIELVESEGKPTYVLHGVEFLELSLVAIPADPSAGFSYEGAVQAAYAMKQADVSKFSNQSAAQAYSAPTGTTMVYAKESNSNFTGNSQTPSHKSVEVTTMADDKMEQILASLTAIAESQKALSEKVATVEAKVAEKATIQPAPAAPAKMGVVTQEDDNETIVKDDFKIEREGKTFSISLSSYDNYPAFKRNLSFARGN